MRPAKLEAAGFVTGHLELCEDGKVLQFLEAVRFALKITPDVIVAAVSQREGTNDERKMLPRSTKK
jgi:hypothetical protein